MHQVIRDHLETFLSESEEGRLPSDFRTHLEACESCRQKVQQMKEQAGLLTVLRETREVEPRPGFYARVLDRIDSQRGDSIWSVFVESPFGRRIAFASLILVVLVGTYLVSSEPMAGVAAPQSAAVTSLEDEQGAVVSASTPQETRDAVLVNLASYRDE